MVISVFQQCETERQGKNGVETKDSYERTSQYTNVGRRQVVEILKCFKKTGTIPTLGIVGNQSNHQTSIDTSVEGNIRTYIINKHISGESCTSSHIQVFLEERLKKKIPTRTIRDHLKRMGFTYGRTRKKTRSLREKEEIRQQRHTYLYNLNKLRKEGYKDVYLDESYLHHFHGHQFSWFDKKRGDFLERPSGKGRRWCFIHAVTSSCLLSNTLHIFEGKKSTGDYHDMFNGPHFQEWFKEKLLPSLPRKSVVILDRATYHRVPKEQLMPSLMKKQELQEWLQNQGISYNEDWLKPLLVKEMRRHIDETPIIEIIANKAGHKVLFLPVHHPELNPIELVWAVVKNECGRLLKKGTKFGDVKSRLEDSFVNIKQSTLEGIYQKILAFEQKYWESDLELDSLTISAD